MLSNSLTTSCDQTRNGAIAVSHWERILRSRSIVLPTGLLDGWIGIASGRVVALGSGDPKEISRSTVDDLTDYVILPGLIDTHVHIRYPGHPEREDFETGTRAAAAGGVTTVLEMPISVPPTWNVDLFEKRVNMARGRTYVDMGFYAAGGYQAIDHIMDLAQAGAVGYKIFLHRPQRGREHEFEGLWAVETGHIYKAFQEIAKTGLKACVHAEDDELLTYCQSDLEAEGRVDPMSHIEGHPVLAETLSIQRAAMIAAATGTRLNICHLSSGSGAAIVREAKRKGIAVTAETCPHYLYRQASDMEEYGPYAKINPPLRSPEEQALLWQGVKDGTVDFIGSDHAPYTREEKERGRDSIWDAPAGCPGLETTLPLLLQAVSSGQLSWMDLARITAGAAASEFGLASKGSIAVGKDADLAVVEMTPGRLSADTMFTRSKETAKLYDGQPVPGQLIKTFVRGGVVYDHGRIVGLSAHGQVVRPGR